MAESDTILQLGIEAAREGNREEARNLFGLLTRQEPDNAQAWLWLAGVAEGPEQRRAALERVVELDPTNEMAVKGLQAMGVSPTAKLDEPAIGAAAAAAASSPPPPAPARSMTDEERYAAELDSAFDDYDTVPKAETPRREPDETTELFGSSADRSSRPSGRTARERRDARQTSTPVHSSYEDDDMSTARPRRPSNLLFILLGAIVLALVLFLGLRALGLFGGPETAGLPTAVGVATGTPESGGVGGTDGTAQATAEGQLGGTGNLTGTTELPTTAPLTDTTGLTPTGELAPTPAPTGTPGPAQPSGPIVANPNLQPVPLGTFLEANGVAYTYPQGLCPASCAVVLGKQVGNFTAQGTYVLVLVVARNNTGTAQPIPANFFALKDAQNNVYTAQPPVSTAARQLGYIADATMETPIPANGLDTSVMLVFDVTPGAQSLTLFAAGKNDQGWPLNVVP